MPNFPRTDLAVDAEAIHRSAAAVTELPGVRAEETERRGFAVTEVHVLDVAGEMRYVNQLAITTPSRSTRCCGARTTHLKTRRRRSPSCCVACCR